MADGPFYAIGRGVVPDGNFRVQGLGDAVEDGHILHNQADGTAQVLIPLDMGWNADLVQHSGDLAFQVDLGLVLYQVLAALVFPVNCRGTEALQVADSSDQDVDAEGL